MPRRVYTPTIEALENRTLLTSVVPSMMPDTGIIPRIQIPMTNVVDQIHNSISPVVTVQVRRPETVRIPLRPNQPLMNPPSMPKVPSISYAPDWNKIDWTQSQEIFWQKITTTEWMSVPPKVLKQLPWRSIDLSIIRNLPWSKMQSSMEECLPVEIREKCLPAEQMKKESAALQDHALDDMYDDSDAVVHKFSGEQLHQPPVPAIVLSTVALAHVHNCASTTIENLQKGKQDSPQSFLSKVGNFFRKRFSRYR